MQWLMGNSSRFVKSSVFAPIFAVATAYAVDDDKLWLPSQYSEHYLELQAAAVEVESRDRCVRVLRATIDIDLSMNGQRIYRVLCRRRNNKTFNELVDGPTKIILSEKKLTPEELEQRKLEDWNLCIGAVKDKIRLMEGVEWLTTFPPVPDELVDERTRFTLDFDAQDMHGNALRYQAKCLVENGVVRADVDGRKEKVPPEQTSEEEK